MSPKTIVMTLTRCAKRNKKLRGDRMTLFQHGYALLVGVGADLPVTIKDATGLCNILVDPQRCGYPTEQVKLLIGELANKSGILQGLDWLQQKVNSDPQATAIVYFSGHGGQALSNYYLLPFGYDSSEMERTAISGSEFTDKLCTLNAQKLLILLDCCHAGGLTEAKMHSFVKSPIPIELATVLTAGSGRVMIASSRKNELSYTSTPFSVFT